MGWPTVSVGFVRQDMACIQESLSAIAGDHGGTTLAPVGSAADRAVRHQGSLLLVYPGAECPSVP
jgi:hypothetical protein